MHQCCVYCVSWKSNPLQSMCCGIITQMTSQVELLGPLHWPRECILTLKKKVKLRYLSYYTLNYTLLHTQGQGSIDDALL